jgi:hypothetical protein
MLAEQLVQLQRLELAVDQQMPQLEEAQEAELAQEDRRSTEGMELQTHLLMFFLLVEVNLQ